MLSGIYFPDEGHIYINGKEEVIKSPKDAFDLGIGMVHQHFKLIDVLSATENIILAAATAKGVTVINNAAKEPDILIFDDNAEHRIKNDFKEENPKVYIIK